MTRFHKLTQDKDHPHVKFRHNTSGELVTLLAIVAKGGKPHYLVATLDGKKQAYLPINEIEEHVATVTPLFKNVIAPKRTS